MTYHCKKCDNQTSHQPFTDGLCDLCWLIKHAPTATTAEQARDYAIDWQNLVSDLSLSLAELAEQQAIFATLAEKFDLTDEFKENGII